MDFLAQEFLQDFLDESDEHLRAISAHLLELEARRAQPDEAVLNELFRAFHTLKGLCGMVGLQAASELAHLMESLLRDVRKGERRFTPPLVDALLEGVQTLQGLIEPLRTPDAPPPDAAPLARRLRALLGEEVDEPPSGAAPPPPPEEERPPEPPPAEERPPAPPPDVQAVLPPEVLPHLRPEDVQRVRQAVAAGKHICVALFEPRPERAGQGLNVNSVRARLEAAAEIIKGVPLISGRQVRFAFILSCEQPPDEDAFPALSWLRPAETPPPPPAPALQRARRQGVAPSLRVEISRLDELLQLVGDLVVTRTRLHAALQQARLGEMSDPLNEIEHRLARQIRSLREAVMRTRMVPLAEVFGRMPLAVRDLARREGKQVRLRLEGEHIEIDKSMVERLLDPLLHMVRNAVTHGLESPEERLAAGKEPQGVLLVRAESAGERVVIHVQDDGRGVDLKRVAARAHALGLLESPRPISAEEALDFLTRPGFSTRAQADMGAGRGVGMDVVMTMVSNLGGELTLSTEAGRGATFTMSLPLSLTIFDAVLLEAGGERYAIPRDAVRRVLEIEARRISPVEGGEWYALEGQAVPLVRLARLFGLPETGGDAPPLGLLLASAEQPILLGVERLPGMQEIVMHAIHDPLVTSPGLAGATELGDGSVILVLDAGALARLARGGL